LGHVYEETDNPFLRSCGQEQEKMTLLACKLTGCQRQELIRNLTIARGQCSQRLFFDDPNLSVGDRLGSDVVFFDAFQSENVTWEIKAGNLPTSFSEDLAGANGAADDLVDAVGRIVLVNNFAFAGIDLTMPTCWIEGLSIAGTISRLRAYDLTIVTKLDRDQTFGIAEYWPSEVPTDKNRKTAADRSSS
jgi:hypothetical protein